MLVLARRIGEKICIGDEIELVVIGVSGASVKLGFSAPRAIVINRAERLVEKADSNCRSEEPVSASA